MDEIDQASFRPVTVGRKGGAALMRRQSQMTKTIEAKKDLLFNKQAGDYSTWVCDILSIPQFEGELLPSLQSGVALCLLVNKIAPEQLTQFTFPTSLKNANLFKAMENINLFLSACEVIGIKNEDLFQPNDLLEGINKLKILRTLQCLKKIHEGNTGYEYDKFERANFDLDFLGSKTPEVEQRERRPTMKIKVDESIVRRSFRLFKGQSFTDGFLTHMDVPITPPPKKEFPKNIPKPITTDPSSTQSKIPLTPTSIPSEEQGSIPFPSGGEVEIPIFDDDDEEHGNFLEPMDPNIMAHLLSKDIDDDEEYDDDYDEDEDVDHDDFHFEQDEKTREVDELIQNLRNEVQELQEILKTEIVSHIKEMEMQDESFRFTKQLLSETEKRAIEAERRAKEAEERSDKFQVMLEERDQSIALLSQMYNDQLAKLSEMMEKMEAEAKIRAQLEDQISENLALIDSYANPDNDHNFEVKNEEKETKQSEADKRRNKKKNKNKNKNRRLSVAAAKRKSTLEIPTLQLQNEMEKELGLPQIQTQVIVEEEEEEENTNLQSPIVEEEPNSTNPQLNFPLSYEPSISIERALSLPKNVTTLWCNQSDVKVIIAHVGDKERSKQETIFELITTEEAYIADLELIIRVFTTSFYNLLQQQLITQQNYDIIFRNLESVVRVNIAFYQELKSRKEAEWPFVKGIGDIFLKHVVYFDIYAEYCGDQKRATQEIKRLSINNPHFKKALDLCHAKPECRKLDIFAFLLLPMQRLTKYPLLLKSLIKATPPDHPDFEYLKAAMTELSRLISAVDDHAKRRDDLVRIFDIGTQLDYLAIGLENIIDFSDSEKKGRYLVREGFLVRLRLKSHSLTAEKGSGRKFDKLYCFFLSDMFIFTKQVTGAEGTPPRYIVQVAPLHSSDYSVRNVPEATNGTGAKNVFLISSKATGTIVLQASSSEEKEQWINDFRKEDLIVESLLNIEDQSFYNRRPGSAVVDESVNRHSSVEMRGNPRRTSVFGIPRPHSSAESGSLKIRRTQSNNEGGSVRESTDLDESKASFDSIILNKLTEPEFDGWLKFLSRKAFQTSWKTRWCVLKDFCLYLFPDDHKESSALGMIVLPGYQIINAKGANKKHVFKAVHHNSTSKEYVFSADTREYMDVWIEALTHATMARVARRNFWL